MANVCAKIARSEKLDPEMELPEPKWGRKNGFGGQGFDQVELIYRVKIYLSLKSVRS